MMLFQNEESYKKRISRYREWYENKSFLKALRTYMKFYYELSKEEQFVTEEDIGNIRDNLLSGDVD